LKKILSVTKKVIHLRPEIKHGLRMFEFIKTSEKEE
jgi:hypothetical protein